MSTMAFGDAFTRALDPTTDTHYCLSEDAQLELRMLFSAMRTMAHILDPNPGDIIPEIEGGQIAPIFFTFAAHGHRLIDEMPCRYPAKRGDGATTKGASA